MSAFDAAFVESVPTSVSRQLDHDHDNEEQSHEDRGHMHPPVFVRASSLWRSSLLGQVAARVNIDSLADPLKQP